VNVAATGPRSPSVIDTSPTETVGASSSTIVPTPVPSAIVARTAPLSRTVNCSFCSDTVSPFARTVIVADRFCGLIVTVPARG
jgi:hypothetical protein